MPHLARPEDTLSGGCASLDPSPKKQKTSGHVKISETCKRSRLEEQLTCSSAELRYIDSQSPEQIPTLQQVRKTFLVFFFTSFILIDSVMVLFHLCISHTYIHAAAFIYFPGSCPCRGAPKCSEQ